MKKKNIIYLLVSILIIALLLCGCNNKAVIESKIKEYDEKLTNLNNDLEYYQGIYDEALSTYQQYNKYSGNSEWDTELSRTEEIMNTAQSKIYSIERDIALYENFKESQERALEKYE